MSEKKPKALEGNTLVLLVDGEHYKAMEQTYEMMCDLLEAHGAETPTFDQFCKDMMMVGAGMIHAKMEDAVKKAMVLDILHRMGML